MTGVAKYLGYCDTYVFHVADARTLAEWLRRDGDTEGAEAVEEALR